jgi:hypothetical protein
MQRFGTTCTLLGIACCVSVAQTTKTPPPVTTVKPAVDNRPAGTDEMREHLLRVFREQILARTLDNIKKMDEAGLRVSARNQLLSYLATDKAPADEKQALATQIARDALTDLRDHADEITPFMRNYLSNDLAGWIQKYRPGLSEDFEKTLKATANADPSQRIRSLFELDGGDTLAAKRIRQELREHGALNGLNFWLEELLKRNSKEFEPLAADIVKRAGEGEISLETLFWISDIYLRPQISTALRNRFLATVVARTQPANFVMEPAPQIAYDLLIKLLPSIKHFTPSLQDRALNQSFALRASLNERQLAHDARVKRLSDSVNPIEDLKSEAVDAKTKTERNELLLQAAQLALEKKRLELCLDILGQLDVTVAAADPAFWQRSMDQIAKNVVRAALTAKLADLAEKAATRIGATLTRIEALTLVMRYYTKANEKDVAQRLLTEASKAAESGPDNSEKSKAFFLLSVASDPIDELKQPDLTLSGIKTLNNLPQPDAGARDKATYQTYVQRLDNSGYELTKAFKALTKHDENSALALVEKLQKTDLRTFALIGILLGVDELLTTSN